MYDPAMSLHTVSGWNLDHSPSVANLLECSQKLDNSTEQRPDTAGLLNPKTVEKTVDALIQHEITKGEARSKAIQQARFTIGRELVEAVSEDLEHYSEQWEQLFEQAAEQYTEAVELLPLEFTANDVVTFTPEKFTAYTKATEAATVINSAKAWLMSLSNVLPGQQLNTSTTSTAFLVVDPGSVENYARVQFSDSRGADTALLKVDPVLLSAVHHGAHLRMAVPSRAVAEIAEYESERQRMSAAEWSTTRQAAGA